MELNNLKESYVKDLADIEKECFEAPWTETAFLKDITNENAVYSIADADGSAIGYIGGYVAFDTVYINNIAVKSDYRNRGVGTALLKDFINKISLLYLNIKNQKFQGNSFPQG